MYSFGKDFANIKPDFQNGDFKWFKEEELNKYISSSQADNLPKLSDLMCFVVIGPSIKDYVLINKDSKPIDSKPYSMEGRDQIEAKINILKISKHFDNHE